MTDTDRLKWLNWYVQNEDTIRFWEEDGSVVVSFGPIDNIRMTAGSSIEDCIDRIAELHPMP
jgi:hypothetical protein